MCSKWFVSCGTHHHLNKVLLQPSWPACQISQARLHSVQQNPENMPSPLCPDTLQITAYVWMLFDKLNLVLPFVIGWILDILTADCLDWQMQLHKITHIHILYVPDSSWFLQRCNQNYSDWPHGNLLSITWSPGSAAGGRFHPEHLSYVHVQQWQDGLHGQSSLSS